jgi:hypothetical protein
MVRQARQGRKQFFFATKNQKTLVYRALALPHRAGKWIRVSASSFKKKHFLPYGETELLA